MFPYLISLKALSAKLFWDIAPEPSDINNLSALVSCLSVSGYYLLVGKYPHEIIYKKEQNNFYGS